MLKRIREEPGEAGEAHGLVSTEPPRSLPDSGEISWSNSNFNFYNYPQIAKLRTDAAEMMQRNSYVNSGLDNTKYAQLENGPTAMLTKGPQTFNKLALRTTKSFAQSCKARADPS